MHNGQANLDFGLEFSLNYIDYDLYSPTDLDQKRNDFDSVDSAYSSLPIIRIFGRTDAGQHVCALIHGVFPYFFIEYEGILGDQSTGNTASQSHLTAD